MGIEFWAYQYMYIKKYQLVKIKLLVLQNKLL